jgi:hypothetical protein
MRTRTGHGAAFALALICGCGTNMSTSGDGSMNGDGSSGPADSGFRAKPNGFQFQNYGPDYVMSDLTPADVQRMFGDQVCASMMGGCVLTPPMEQWRQQMIKAVGGGHCEGFAALSLLFFSGKAKPSDFGAATTYDLQIANNVPLQRELAYWWATQTVAPTATSKVAGSPSALVDALAALFNAGAMQETATIWFFKSNMTEGHAVTPYAVRDNGSGKWSILIYDNNFPGQERSIEVDRNANTWSYSTAANPADMASLYTGDANTATLGLTPTTPRLGKQMCPACGNATMAGPMMGSTGQVIMHGSGSMLIADDAGHQLGTMNGAMVNNFPGASVIGLTGDLDPTKDLQAPLLQLPTGAPLSITLDGTGMAAASMSDLELVMPGYTLGVQGDSLAPGQQDTLTVSKLGDEVAFSTGAQETPTLELGVQGTDAAFSFFIKATGDASGQKVDLKIDLAKQQLRVECQNSAGTTAYDIEIHRIDANGEQVFTHSGNSELSADAVYLDYGAWAGNGQPMTAELDTGADGTIDAMTSLSDDK